MIRYLPSAPLRGETYMHNLSPVGKAWIKWKKKRIERKEEERRKAEDTDEDERGMRERKRRKKRKRNRLGLWWRSEF